MVLYGYMRVSSIGQNDIRQRFEIEKFGVEPSRIYADKMSGYDFNRPQYKQLRSILKQGDVLVVKSLDRLGRNYIDILNEWRTLTQDMQVDIVILDMPLLDTRTSNDLIGKLISDIVLGLLSYVAQTERDFIKQRQKEGIYHAKNNGVKFGRPTLPYPPDFDVFYDRYNQKLLDSVCCSRALNITQEDFQKLVRRRQKQLSRLKNI